MSVIVRATLAKLQEDLGGERDVMRELVETFLGEVPRMLDAMRAGLAEGNLREVNRTTHSLKSTAGTFGADALSTLCRALEHDTLASLPPDAAPRVAAIESEWAKVRAELEAWLRES